MQRNQKIIRTMLGTVAGMLLLAMPGFASDACIDCHSKVSPGVVADWKASKHSQIGTTCETCHGSEHKSAVDANKAKMASAEVCEQCHKTQVTQFMSGKHAKAWPTVMNVPNYPQVPRLMMEGAKGCGGCHKFAPKSVDQVSLVQKAGTRSQASCDICHTRHTFSKVEASQPQACQTCHQGEDHPTWALYSGSKHGVRVAMKQIGALPQDAAAPTCQTCHMSEGNHAVRTAWGFFGIRFPFSEDPKWAADQKLLYQSFGILDADGNPTPGYGFMKEQDMFRTTKEDWQQERNKMITTCTKCHAESFAKSELDKDDNLLKESDELMAQGIRIVSDLYKDGIVKPSASHPGTIPQLMTFHAKGVGLNPAEEKLFEMFLDHRPNLYMGAFHNNPEYPIYVGYGAMQRDLYEIKEISDRLRKEKAEEVSFVKSH